MKISEIFYSIQGEGTEIGLPTTFVRLFACDLRCSWCDTMYAVEGRDFKDIPVEKVIEQIENIGNKRVCFTGGEPLLQKKELVVLAEHLLNNDYGIILETSGHKDPPQIFWNDGCIISMDCKCPSSNMELRMDFPLFEKLRPIDQLKFVIKDEKDYEYAKSVIEKLKIKSKIIFQPVYGYELKWLVESVLNDKLEDVRVLTQLHKLVWGEKRGV